MLNKGSIQAKHTLWCTLVYVVDAGNCKIGVDDTFVGIVDSYSKSGISSGQHVWYDRIVTVHKRLYVQKASERLALV